MNRIVAIVVVVLSTVLTAQQRPPAFEVASLKPSRSADSAWAMGCANGGPVGKIPAGHCVGTNVLLLHLIAQAYGLPSFSAAQRVSGLSGWASSTRFDLNAKAENAAAPEAELRLMLRQLLAHRFRLRLHEEVKRVDGYALIASRGGPRLKKIGEQKPPAQPVALALRATNTDMLANALASRLGRPVVNRTSITGDYDFRITSESISQDTTGASLFTVIEEQFGLKLEPQKVPLTVLVVDYVEQPTAN